MKIKYLRDTHDSVAGDEKEVPDLQANVLVQLGVAEIAKAPAKTPIKNPAKNSKKD